MPVTSLKSNKQIAAFRVSLQPRFDVLVEPVGRTEEQIALQVQALDLSAMGKQDFLIVPRAVERAAVLRAAETEFDRLDPRRAERKRRAADDDADQDAGDKAPLR